MLFYAGPYLAKILIQFYREKGEGAGAGMNKRGERKEMRKKEEEGKEGGQGIGIG